jgi:hypothetical protein
VAAPASVLSNVVFVTQDPRPGRPNEEIVRDLLRLFRNLLKYMRTGKKVDLKKAEKALEKIEKLISQLDNGE